MPPALIVVTDLDGTLLDHYTYSWTPAQPALKRLRRLGIPLVLNSSKTAAEISVLCGKLDNHEPFIVENGAAIYIPNGSATDDKHPQVDPEKYPNDYTLKSFGMDRAAIVRIAADLRQKQGYRFTGFSDMTVAELMAHTGLNENGAKLALAREYTEPLLWLDNEKNLQEFQGLLQGKGIHMTKGGRFLHLSSAADKGLVLSWLKQHYAPELGEQPRIIALGDSDNDKAMLACADFPVLIKSPVKPFPELEHPHLMHSRLEGPAGWNEAVSTLLDELTGPDN